MRMDYMKQKKIEHTSFILCNATIDGPIERAMSKICFLMKKVNLS